jgi:hypothetical protein
MNALKSGLFAKILPHNNTLFYDHEEFEDLLVQLREDFQPTTQIETLAIESLALNYMRLRRVLEMEQSLFREPTLDQVKDEQPPPILMEPDIPELERNMALMKRFISKIEDKQPFDFSDEEQTILADKFFRSITCHEQAIRNSKEWQAQIQPDTELNQMTPEQERILGKQPSAAEQWARYQTQIDEFQRLNMQEGRYAFKTRDHEQIARILANKEPIPEPLKEKWIGLAWGFINSYQERKNATNAYLDRMDQYRLNLRKMTVDNNSPKLDTVARYEAHIKRNIEKDIKILAGMATAKTSGLGSSFLQN